MTVDRSDTIHLSIEEKIAEGGERLVFAHPDDPTRLIKVIKPRHKDEFDRWTFGHLTQRYIPSTRWRPIVKQYDEYQRLMLNRNYDPNFDLPISHLYGFVKTNLGLGCVTERVTDADGGNAPTLAQLVREKALDEEGLQELNTFIQRLYSVSVCASDVGSKNFVFGQRHIGTKGKKSKPCWVLIDGFGDRFAIQIRTISRFARSYGLDDAFKRKKPVSGLVWVPKERRYAFKD